MNAQRTVRRGAVLLLGLLALSGCGRSKEERATDDYTEAIRLNPRHAKGYINRGVAYANEPQFNKPITDYTQAIRRDTTFALP